MAARISRRKLAAYAARELVAGNAGVLQNVAAYLVEARRTREADLVVRDIESALENQGILLAEVISARELSRELTQQIETFLREQAGVKQVHLTEEVDASVIGGIKIVTPTAVHDNTIKQNISALRALKQ